MNKKALQAKIYRTAFSASMLLIAIEALGAPKKLT